MILGTLLISVIVVVVVVAKVVVAVELCLDDTETESNSGPFRTHLVSLKSVLPLKNRDQ